jgi:hypothetical protein
LFDVNGININADRIRIMPNTLGLDYGKEEEQIPVL